MRENRAGYKPPSRVHLTVESVQPPDESGYLYLSSGDGTTLSRQILASPAGGSGPQLTQGWTPGVRRGRESYTASSSPPGMGPGNTVNRSGLDENDGHSTDGSTMWLSKNTGSHWIQFEFDQVYALHELWV
jgi:hypothetical protein